ncbi:2-hydroxy-3-oxopropionate reductase [Burkholderia plantarii]|uniref:2-hydoxy-3-oxopropionate reductase GlxR n=1 Tax=Burkholderia plantarii TaxID=41899 RepID=A0A0B6RTV4_BURPL|nr:2-hydroxy-3-oxopropionate reductase [Burkholderia plantarii]AJK46808.1 2-hydoxy-3-oxopropionate reductase GlxR [Burkholderia plantarii]ALK30987.1 2-hydroxy-3-oxopropionate reductase [Burkholderia plantarii]WLE59639.1 2-hydroxy-3-oxopropionate reductase [Burkholderia plantarii]GLZ17390.1 2-hydroxy-3-oxopropionate reductase [Burkholderia plantarii]
MATIGFIGLGIMGSHMARNLLKGGHSLVVNGAFPVPDDLRGQARVVANSTAVADSAEIIISMVPDTPDVRSVLFADDGVAKGLTAGKLVIDMSSISPLDTQEFARQINALGCDYLDAPVSGGEVGARDATLTIMVGGPEQAFERARPLFELMGRNISLVGDNGAGQTTKVANQIIVALNLEAVAEALLFAARSGADPERVRRALMGGFASSRILELHGERMTKRTFEPGFRIELHQKDLNLALDGARRLGLALPHTASAQQLFSVCAAHGGKAWDHSGIVRALEIMSNLEIAEPK